MKLIVPLLFLYLFSSLSKDDILTPDERSLYTKIMSYRASKGLPKIAISKSLTIVAQTHANDLDVNRMDTKKGCNLHSWSDKGDWTSCCYTNDHKRASCMWSKPSELTNYTGAGYEIAHWSSNPVTPSGALLGWQNSKGHNEVIVNKGIWKTSKWRAIGIGMKNNYAVVWFGEEADV
jgi:uncharacterized protein YkwD